MPAKYVKPAPGVTVSRVNPNNVVELSYDSVEKSLFLKIDPDAAKEVFTYKRLDFPPDPPDIVKLKASNTRRWNVTPATGVIVMQNPKTTHAIIIDAYGTELIGDDACDRCSGRRNPARPPKLQFGRGCRTYGEGWAENACSNCTASGEQSLCGQRLNKPLPEAPRLPAPARPESELIGARRGSRGRPGEALQHQGESPTD